jgi:hypothetical protein
MVELVADVSPSGRASLPKTASDIGLRPSPKHPKHVSQAGPANGFARHVSPESSQRAIRRGHRPSGVERCPHGGVGGACIYPPNGLRP